MLVAKIDLRPQDFSSVREIEKLRSCCPFATSAILNLASDFIAFGKWYKTVQNRGDSLGSYHRRGLV